MTANAERYEYVSPWRLWFGVAVGPVVWAAHFVTSYAIASLACHWNWFQFRLLGLPALQFILTVFSFAAALIIVYGAFVNYGQWRSLRGETGKDGRPPNRIFERQRFMAGFGVMSNVLHVVVLLLTIAPTLVLAPCGYSIHHP